MNTLKGFYMVCEVTLSILHPQIGMVEERFPAECAVVDDRFDPVGNIEFTRYPVIVDCSSDKTFKMLAPKNETGVYLFYKGEQCAL